MKDAREKWILDSMRYSVHGVKKVMHFLKSAKTFNVPGFIRLDYAINPDSDNRTYSTVKKYVLGDEM
jgi:hypothetical protein